MACRWNQTKHMAAIGLALLVGLATVLDAQAQGPSCRQPTPSPCAADGTCQPNHDSWGYSQTRWRQWPGNPQPEQPTAVESQEVEEEMKLKPFQRPTAEKEGIRSPAKTKSPRTASEDDAEQPEQALPENALPELDQQGSLRAMPLQDDAPPALPRSLRAVALSVGNAPLAKGPVSRTQQPKAYVSSLSGGQSRPKTAPAHRQQALSPEHAVQAVAQQRLSANLVNPAANGVSSGSQLAIYYEDTK